MRILLVGDASNYHAALAEALRRLGEDVTVASDGSRWMDTSRDIDISRHGSGPLSGLGLWLRMRYGLQRRLADFDVVSIATLGFVSLKPARQAAIFDMLRRNNRSVFYTSLGTDTFYVDECMRPDSLLPYNEWRIFGRPSPLALARPETAAAWQSEDLRRACRHVYDRIDGATSVLYEYDRVLGRYLTPDRHAYTGIPIDTDALRPVGLPDRPDKVRLFLGRHRHRMVEKGTDLLEAAARSVVESHPDKAELVIVENRPYDEYLDLMKSAHVVLDQVYSYTPATNALLAMAYGLNTVSGGEEEFYEFIGEPALRPVINVRPDYEQIRHTLLQTVLHPELLAPRGRESREFVVKHNSYDVVAGRYLDFWQRRLDHKDAQT
ncbi:MAG: glycosyltransferase [Duncaniella sp.]|nr:glycosyltransferase [Duncaniella sp.]